MGTPKRERQKANRQSRLEQMARQQKKEAVKRRGTRWALLGALAVALFFLLFVWLGGDDKTTTLGTTPGTGSTPGSTVGSTPGTGTTAGTGAGTTLPGTIPCPKTDGSSEVTTTFVVAPPMCIDSTHTYTAVLDTTEGTIEVALDAAKQPVTVNNFVYLSRYHYYDGTKIFRADTSIDIIQGGATSTADQFGYTIPDEGTTFDYQSGDMVMARTQEPNSAGAQWFIAGGPKVSLLNGGPYVTFGHVTKGLDLVAKMVTYADPADSMSISKDITVNKVTIVESGGSTPSSTAGTGASSTVAATTAATTTGTATTTPAAATTAPTTTAPASTAPTSTSQP